MPEPGGGSVLWVEMEDQVLGSDRQGRPSKWTFWIDLTVYLS